jgi:hypothetical protein
MQARAYQAEDVVLSLKMLLHTISGMVRRSIGQT